MLVEKTGTGHYNQKLSQNIFKLVTQNNEKLINRIILRDYVIIYFENVCHCFEILSHYFEIGY